MKRKNLLPVFSPGILVLIIAFLSANFSGCDEKECCDSPPYPVCVEHLMDQKPPHPELKTIRQQIIQGKDFYWLETGNLATDGPEYIVNHDCDTVCHFCGLCPSPPDCLKEFNHHHWQIIWSK